MFRHIYLLALLALLLTAMVCWSQDTAGQIANDQRVPITAQILGFDL